MDRKHKSLLDLARTLASEEGARCINDAYHSFLSKTNLSLFTLDFTTVQKQYLDVCYNDLYKCAYSRKKDAPKSADPRPQQIHVESEIRKGIVENINHLHVCKLCLQRGRSEVEARNVTAKSFIYRADEAMITQLTCNACGHKWKA